jgi:predicted ATPase
MIDWSYRLLDERERDVFERLSVFAAGCTLDGAEQAAAPTRPFFLRWSRTACSVPTTAAT